MIFEVMRPGSAPDVSLSDIAKLVAKHQGWRFQVLYTAGEAEDLAENGYLDGEAQKQLRDMVRLRNAAVHGDFSVEIGAAEAAALSRLVRAAVDEVFDPDQG